MLVNLTKLHNNILGVNLNDLEYYEIDREKANLVASADTSCPSLSWMRFIIPFSTNPDLKGELTQAKADRIRYGRLLEMMDFISGRVSYRHCNVFSGDVSPCTNVTATVDSVQLFNQHEHNLDENLIIDG